MSASVNPALLLVELVSSQRAADERVPAAEASGQGEAAMVLSDWSREANSRRVGVTGALAKHLISSGKASRSSGGLSTIGNLLQRLAAEYTTVAAWSNPTDLLQPPTFPVDLAGQGGHDADVSSAEDGLWLRYCTHQEKSGERSAPARIAKGEHLPSPVISRLLEAFVQSHGEGRTGIPQFFLWRKRLSECLKQWGEEIRSIHKGLVEALREIAGNDTAKQSEGPANVEKLVDAVEMAFFSLVREFIILFGRTLAGALRGKGGIVTGHTLFSVAVPWRGKLGGIALDYPTPKIKEDVLAIVEDELVNSVVPEFSLNRLLKRKDGDTSFPMRKTMAQDALVCGVVLLVRESADVLCDEVTELLGHLTVECGRFLDSRETDLQHVTDSIYEVRFCFGSEERTTNNGAVCVRLDSFRLGALSTLQKKREALTATKVKNPDGAFDTSEVCSARWSELYTSTGPLQLSKQLAVSGRKGKLANKYDSGLNPEKHIARFLEEQRRRHAVSIGEKGTSRPVSGKTLPKDSSSASPPSPHGEVKVGTLPTASQPSVTAVPPQAHAIPPPPSVSVDSGKLQSSVPPKAAKPVASPSQPKSSGRPPRPPVSASSKGPRCVPGPTAPEPEKASSKVPQAAPSSKAPARDGASPDREPTAQGTEGKRRSVTGGATTTTLPSVPQKQTREEEKPTSPLGLPEEAGQRNTTLAPQPPVTAGKQKEEAGGVTTAERSWVGRAPFSGTVNEGEQTSRSSTEAGTPQCEVAGEGSEPKALQHRLPASADLQKYPFLDEEPAPGVFLADLDLATNPHFRAAVHTLVMRRCNQSLGLGHEDAAAQEKAIRKITEDIAQERQKDTIAAMRRMPFLPARVHGVLLGVLISSLDDDEHFQALHLRRRALLEVSSPSNAVSTGGKQLKDVEAALCEAAEAAAVKVGCSLPKDAWEWSCAVFNDLFQREAQNESVSVAEAENELPPKDASPTPSPTPSPRAEMKWTGYSRKTSDAVVREVSVGAGSVPVLENEESQLMEVGENGVAATVQDAGPKAPVTEAHEEEASSPSPPLPVAEVGTAVSHRMGSVTDDSVSFSLAEERRRSVCEILQAVVQTPSAARSLASSEAVLRAQAVLFPTTASAELPNTPQDSSGNSESAAGTVSPGTEQQLPTVVTREPNQASDALSVTSVSGRDPSPGASVVQYLSQLPVRPLSQPTTAESEPTQRRSGTGGSFRAQSEQGRAPGRRLTRRLFDAPSSSHRAPAPASRPLPDLKTPSLSVSQRGVLAERDGRPPFAPTHGEPSPTRQEVVESSSWRSRSTPAAKLSSVYSFFPRRQPRLSLHFDQSASLRDVYFQACAECGVRPNSGLLQVLPNTSADRVRSLDLGSNYIGPKGIRPLLYVLEENQGQLEALSLSSNSLENGEVQELVEVLCGEAGSRLMHLDLSNNPVSHAGGQALLRLVTANPQLTSVTLSGTLISPKLLETVMLKAKENLRKAPQTAAR